MRNPKFLGVYSLKIATRSGAKPRFFVWRLPDGSFAAQELDASLSQRGPARRIPADGLEKAFVFEPSILAAPITTPDFRQAAKPAARSGKADDVTLASLERARRARQVEKDLRDSFDRAVRALGRPRDRKGALVALERIAKTNEGIEPSHKFMFRDFGVALRKKNLHELALVCARRTVALSPQDDHARFNLARILGLTGAYEEAQAQLGAARKLDPNEKVYARLADYLKRQSAAREDPPKLDKE